MWPQIESSQFLFQDETPRPLGRLTLSGVMKGSRGIGNRGAMRVYGSYALVLLVAGGGFYRDARGFKATVAPGDALLIFPEIAHAYGPPPRGEWDELFVCFDGPVFDCWRREGVLDDARPIHRPPHFARSFSSLKTLLETPRAATPEEHWAQLHTFLALMGEFIQPPCESIATKSWLERAKIALGADLDAGGALERAASAAGMSGETFRKRFTREMGLSPSQFRDQKRLVAAQTLLLRAEMTNALIARTLGFRDEAHFSRRFKQLSKQTPRDFRRAAFGNEKLRLGGFEPPTEAL